MAETDNNDNNGILISGRYRIIKKIASGGMADIFLGTDIEQNRRVAIKILSANYASDKNFVARFRSEAQILARLDHPNIVRVYEWGRFDSSYFISMEYVEGRSLKEIIEKSGALAPVTAVKYAIQISDALRVAHQNNLIHRDIKSQNILITPEGTAKLTDFGIAKSLNTDLTRTINILGTAQYISPEQAQGKILDHRSDIYSLGIVLYEMLTADLPFRGDTSIDISLKHINEKPIPPASLISGIPKKIEKIVMLCLEKDPKRRYHDAGDLKKDLRNFMQGKPLKLGRGKRESAARAGKFLNIVRNNIYAVISTVLMILFLVLFLIFAPLALGPGRRTDTVYPGKVPPIENMPVENAGEILSFFGLELVIEERLYSDDIPSGHIMDQDPDGNTEITGELPVRVTVSLGKAPGDLTVPNLIGLDVSIAEKILEDMGLGAGEISQQFSEFFPGNIVMGQEPDYGKTIPPGQPVNIIVSKGAEVMVIPNLIGLDYVSASNHLKSMGVFVNVSKYPIADGAYGTGEVVEVRPAPGSSIEKNSMVELIICSGEELVPVPDLYDMNLQQAVDLLNESGTPYETGYVDADYALQEGKVMGQIPEAGTYMPPGQKIMIFVGQ
ncbi:MAG: PASTA domain-containing protein [Actinobacteria bacterium]|nr:PASTA domain-containing protein [Actinomycetota bacterium]